LISVTNSAIGEGVLSVVERGAEAQALPGTTDLAAYRQPARGARNMIPTS